MEVQEELDELKQEKRNVKRQIQLADDIIKEDLYTAYYAVTVVVEPDANIEVMNPDNIKNEIGIQKGKLIVRENNRLI